MFSRTTVRTVQTPQPQSRHGHKRRRKGHHSSSRRHKHRRPSVRDFIPSVSGPQKRNKPRSEFLCQPSYHTMLPDPPMKPKYLKLDFQTSRKRLLTRCCASLERSLKANLLPDALLGVPIDIIDTDQYHKDPNVKGGELIAADKSILSGSKKVDMELINKYQFYWQKDLLNNDLYAMGETLRISHTKLQRQKALDAEKRRLARSERMLLCNQKIAIQNSFDEAMCPPVHPTMPDMQPTKVYSLFPGSGGQKYSQLCCDGLLGVVKKAITDQKTNELSGDAADLASRTLFTEHGDGIYSAYVPHNSIPELEEKVISSTPYQWLRQYKSMPARTMEKNNNLFIRFTEDDVHYERYTDIVNLRKVAVAHARAEEVRAFPSRLTLNIKEELEDDEDEADPFDDVDEDASDLDDEQQEQREQREETGEIEEREETHTGDTRDIDQDPASMDTDNNKDQHGRSESYNHNQNDNANGMDGRYSEEISSERDRDGGGSSGLGELADAEEVGEIGLMLDDALDSD